jgi:protein TonB
MLVLSEPQHRYGTAMKLEARTKLIASAGAVGVHILFAAAVFLLPMSGGSIVKVGEGRPLIVSLVPIGPLQSGGNPETVTETVQPEAIAEPTTPRDEPAVVEPQSARLAAPSDGAQIGPSTAAAPSVEGESSEQFHRALLAHIEQFRRYPEAARRQHIQGVVTLRFTMDRDGNLVDVWVDQTSGFTVLDAEAVATVKRAAPLPGIPANLPGRLSIVFPIPFELQ